MNDEIAKKPDKADGKGPRRAKAKKDEPVQADKGEPGKAKKDKPAKAKKDKPGKDKKDKKDKPGKAKKDKPGKDKKDKPGKAKPRGSERPERARKITIAHREVTTREEAVAHLETLLGAVRSGSVRLERNDDVMVLEVPEQLQVGVKASQSGKSERLTLTVRWRRGGEEPLLVKHG